MGNVPSNDQSICCEVGDWWGDGGWNYGCTVMAARLIRERGMTPTSWSDYETWVNEHGGFLTDNLRKEVKELWNLGGNVAYSHRWAAGLTPTGNDENGLIWRYNPQVDHRMDILKSII